MPTSLSPEAPVLFLDAAAPIVVAGLQAGNDEKPSWRESSEEAGIALARATDALLRTRGVPLDDVRTVVWCDGPGSLLGIRLAAMMVRTWLALPRTAPLRVLAYHSLALVAADRLDRGQRPPFHVCSDARRNTWNVLPVSATGALGAIRRYAPEELSRSSEPLFVPESFPHWQPLPPRAQRVPYLPQHAPGLARRFSLLRETPAPDAFLTDPPTYRTWSPSTSP